MAFTRNLNGGSGGDFDGGGGTPGTATGSTSEAGLPVGENGGVLATTYWLFVPVQAVSGQSYIAFYDPDDGNDPVDGSSYAYRREDVVKHRVPTVNRVILVYRDLGLCKLTVGLNGTNDLGQIVSQAVQVQLGNAVATNALLTKFVDIQLTAFMPQLVLTRAAGDGPLCIVSATIRGEVED